MNTFVPKSSPFSLFIVPYFLFVPLIIAVLLPMPFELLVDVIFRATVHTAIKQQFFSTR